MWNRKITFGLLGVGVSYVLVQGVWLSTSVKAPVPDSAIKSQTGTSSPVSETAKQSTADSAEAPTITQGNTLKLVGVLVAGEGGGSALIASDAGEEKVFLVGDTVPGGAMLKAIYRDRVLLESRRGIETLRLRLDAVPYQGSGHSEDSPPLSETNVTEYFIPATSSTGALVGYRISPHNHMPRFEQLGLLPSDIITAVHALSLTQPESRMRALARLKSDEFASVTFIRDGNKLINITIMPEEEPTSSQ